VTMTPKISTEKTVGIDVFLDSNEKSKTIGPAIEKCLEGSPFKLKIIANRGMQVYPFIGGIESDESPHHQCRIVTKDLNHCDDSKVMEVLNKISSLYKWVHIERLRWLDDKSGYTKSQGEE
jgi:isocitrate dehydrogenase